MRSAIDHPQMAQDVPDPRLCLIGDTRIDATAAAKFRKRLAEERGEIIRILPAFIDACGTNTCMSSRVESETVEWQHGKRFRGHGSRGGGSRGLHSRTKAADQKTPILQEQARVPQKKNCHSNAGKASRVEPYQRWSLQQRCWARETQAGPPELG